MMLHILTSYYHMWLLFIPLWEGIGIEQFLMFNTYKIILIFVLTKIFISNETPWISISESKMRTGDSNIQIHFASLYIKKIMLITQFFRIFNSIYMIVSANRFNIHSFFSWSDWEFVSSKFACVNYHVIHYFAYEHWFSLCTSYIK